MPVKAKKKQTKKQIFALFPLSKSKVITQSRSIHTSLYEDWLFQLRNCEIVKKIQSKDEPNLESVK